MFLPTHAIRSGSKLLLLAEALCSLVEFIDFYEQFMLTVREDKTSNLDQEKQKTEKKKQEEQLVSFARLKARLESFSSTLE